MDDISRHLANFENIQTLVTTQIAIAPHHRRFFEKRFANCSARHLQHAEILASQVVAISEGNIELFATHYDWLCEMVKEEEIAFLRSGNYRLSTFEQALAEVYSRDDFMFKYMNGLLMTQVFWSNHTDSFSYYLDNFLENSPEKYSHLEIGPGHGLLLVQAVNDARSKTVEAWDVSAQSIENTKHAIDALTQDSSATYRVQDIFALQPSETRFDNIVLSEVLEHLDRPEDAIRELKGLLSDRGRLFVNMPVNSPAPDHLFLLRSPEAVVEFLEAQGMIVESSHFSPQTNYTMEKARKMNLTISCSLIARNP